jgi:asparagine synthase (glutamine-hydrolysing)
MCGIAGVMDFRGSPPSRALVRAMVLAMRHRGPDEFGLYLDPRVALGHARLSIIDLAAGQQPLANEDGTLWVVFNGEIFNHVELRAELEALGHRFKTRSDTEVIVHAWEEWREAAFARFNGQWAFALWDSARGELTLCRDRVGVRPLYLHEGGGRVRFASEVKSLFADGDVPRRIDPRGMNETFTFWSPVAPVTVFEGVAELAPGTFRTYRADGSYTERTWWRPDFPRVFPRETRAEYPYDETEAAARLLDALRGATRLRMLRADVPVGAYLSGGIDSSVVATLAREVVGETLHTFSLRFEDGEYDETRWQRVMAERLKSEHHEVVASRRDIARVFPDVVWHAERPLLRTGPAPLFMLSRLVRDAGLKVVVTGEGADEMLGGYDLFREAKLRRFWARQPQSKLRPRLFDRLYPYLARSPQAARALSLQFWQRGLDRPDDPAFSHAPRWASATALQRYLAAPLRAAIEGDPQRDRIAARMGELPSDFARWDPLARAQYLEVVTLLSPYILSAQGDRVLMGNSIEGRFPFLDADVMAFANELPARYKVRVLDEKHLLKRAARGLIPDEIIARPKQPYRAPDALCFVTDDAPEYVPEVLSTERVNDAGIFDAATVTALYVKCRNRARALTSGDGAFSNADNMALVGILSAQIVHERFIRPHAPVEDSGETFRTEVVCREG